MPKMTYKFGKRHSYRNMKRLEHNGDIGFGTGENITTHITNMLDHDHCYKEINGELHVRSLRVRMRKGQDGTHRLIHDSGKFIPLSQHMREEFPQMESPL